MCTAETRTGDSDLDVQRCNSPHVAHNWRNSSFLFTTHENVSCIETLSLTHGLSWAVCLLFY